MPDIQESREIVENEFPTEVFSPVIRQFIEEGAESRSVSTDYIALPMLGLAAATFGNTLEIQPRPGWTEKANLWLAMIGKPGDGKSPAMKYATEPLYRLQREASKTYKEQRESWEALAKLDKKNTPPDEPVLEHFYTNDATMEAMIRLLETSRGAAIVRDELTGWIASHDAYKNKGGDRENYLSLWNGMDIKPDRIGSGSKLIHAPVAPIIGGIQPDKIRLLVDAAGHQDGFIDRFLMLWPKEKPALWEIPPITPEVSSQVTEIFRTMRYHVPIGETVTLRLTTEAATAYGEWFMDNEAIKRETEGMARGFYAKYRGQLSKIILVLHALNYPGEKQALISIETVRNGIEVIEYFRAHLNKVLYHFNAAGSNKTAGLGQRIMRILSRDYGEWMARRELRDGLGNSASAEEMSVALTKLVEQGLIENREVPTSGRARLECRAISSTTTVDDGDDEWENF
ncbi:MAG: DUF3987 domain-containing protein [Thermoleophilaceae bacterium]|nr:DUF3987 domain-containing protein [Thermoleophilaceae bacterium]